VIRAVPASPSRVGAVLGADPADVLLVHVRQPAGHGVTVLQHAAPDIEVLLMSGGAATEAALDTIRRNGARTLTDPADFARVTMALGHLTRTLNGKMKGEITTMHAELGRMDRLGAIVGHSPAMQDVYRLIGRGARTGATVLITGETGTGKELVARAIHTLSRRSRERFVAVNCGAVSAHVAESELFGHERGSFTGADRIHKGYFEQAHGGTLFLDEIAETPADLQVKLLRALESGVLSRVGGTESIPVDLRIVAATNRHVADAVALGKLREDLFYRLNVFPIHVPPLRERDGDAELLADHFLGTLNAAEGTAKELTPAFRERLRRHTWPGNVRELKNVMERAFILTDDCIDVDLWPAAATDGAASFPGPVVGTSIAEMERALILSTLGRCNGNRNKAAAALQISLRTLSSRLIEYRASGTP
jgi:DNA-binding NtrC family response regulator